MTYGFYYSQYPGSSGLSVAAAELRQLSKLEFLMDGNSLEGIVYCQLSTDLRRLSEGDSIRSTAIWHAFAVYCPFLFRQSRNVTNPEDVIEELPHQR